MADTVLELEVMNFEVMVLECMMVSLCVVSSQTRQYLKNFPSDLKQITDDVKLLHEKVCQVPSFT